MQTKSEISCYGWMGFSNDNDDNVDVNIDIDVDNDDDDDNIIGFCWGWVVCIPTSY